MSLHKPVILAPVDRPAEVALLAAAGADELYGGVLPADWADHVSSPNQRTFASAQFASEGEFAAAAIAARDNGVTLHLALNAPVYDPSVYPSLIGLAERAATWGVAGLIVGDLGLLARLGELALPLELTLSTMGGAMNHATVRFYRRFPIRRVVLPRHLCLEEMKELVAYHPDLRFEAFVLIGRCPHEEALCTFQHINPAKRWPCEIPYSLSDAAEEPLTADHPYRCWHEQWRQTDRRLACGLCGIPRLHELGVRHLKLVGRGAPTDGKVTNVRLVRDFLDGSMTHEQAQAAYRARFGRTCQPLSCYFPELHPTTCR